MLSVPIDTINDQDDVCIEFTFESENTNILMIEAVTGSEHRNYTYSVYSNGRQCGQINYGSEIDEFVSFSFTF